MYTEHPYKALRRAAAANVGADGFMIGVALCVILAAAAAWCLA